MKINWHIETRKIVLLFLTFVLFCACKKENQYNGVAHFIVTNEKWITTNYGCPAITVTVKNDGGQPGYNVAVEYKLKNGNTIVDTGTAYPANLGDIEPGESATDDAVFFNTISTTGMIYTYKITWLEY